MFKEVTKSWRVCQAVIPLMIMTSCGGDSVADKATALYVQAQEADAAGRYQLALDMIDSIDRIYPAAVEVRRDAMQLRPRVLEKLTVRQLEAVDSVAAVSAWRLDSISWLMQEVPNSVERYFVPKAEGHVNVSSTPGLHARMAPDGRFYLVACSPRHINMSSVSISSNGETVNMPSVAYDGERNDRAGALDVITYIEGECQEVGEFVSRHRDSQIKVTYVGQQSVSVQLSDAQRLGIATTFEAASLARERKKQELEKQRLERMLQAVRSQIAGTVRDTIAQ